MTDAGTVSVSKTDRIGHAVFDVCPCASVMLCPLVVAGTARQPEAASSSTG